MARRLFFFVLFLCSSSAVQAAACLIESNDDQLPIRMCQQNISIPAELFKDSFCQPEIAGRSFEVNYRESCPEGAYGICNNARSEGVAYRQAIHYYSDPDDQPVLQAYCEQFSEGEWLVPGQVDQNGGGGDN